MQLARVRLRSRRLVAVLALLCFLTTVCLVLLAPGDPWCDVVISRVFGARYKIRGGL